MKSLSTLAALAVLAGGCAGSSGMSLSFQHTIPKGASMIRLRSELSPRDLFSQASTLLAEQGYSFAHLDSSALAFETDAMPIGNSKTPLRLAVHIKSEGNGSTLEATGQTLIGPGAWVPATNGADQKAKVGFQEMTMLIGKLPNREISYYGS
jgi:hypothetical protein